MGSSEADVIIEDEPVVGLPTLQKMTLCMVRTSCCHLTGQLRNRIFGGGKKLERGIVNLTFNQIEKGSVENVNELNMFLEM